MIRPPCDPCTCDRDGDPPQAAAAEPKRDCAPLAPPPPSYNPPSSTERTPETSDTVSVRRWHQIERVVSHLIELGLRLLRLWDAVPEDVRHQLMLFLGGG